MSTGDRIGERSWLRFTDEALRRDVRMDPLMATIDPNSRRGLVVGVGDKG